MGVEGEDVKIEVVGDPHLKEEDPKLPPDPGQMEGKKKVDPRETHPPEGSPRWNEIYRKAKEGDRLKQEFEDYKKAQEGKQQASDIAIRKLTKALDKFTGTASTKVEEDTGVREIETLNGRLTGLKKERKEARDKADFDKVDYLDDQIFEVRTSIRDIEKAQKTKKTEKPHEDPDEDEDAAYDTFMETNKDWLADPAMAGAAGAYERKLRKDPKWKDRATHEILDEVAKLTVERFKWKKKGAEPKVEGNKPNDVEDGGHRPTKPAPGTVQMTSAEMELARGFGIEPVEWAKEKAKGEGGMKHG